MTFCRFDVVARLRQLAAHLVELKHRVRRAVATETGRAVADAVKDLVVAVLDGTVCRDPYRPQYYDPGPDEWTASNSRGA